MSSEPLNQPPVQPQVYYAAPNSGYNAPPSAYPPQQQQLPPNATQSLYNPALYGGQNPWVTSTLGVSNNAILASLLNFFLGGVGHILIGQFKKGIAFLIWYFAIIIICSVVTTVTFGLGFPIYIIAIIHFILIIVDGAMIGQRLDKGYPVHQGECAIGLVKIGLGLFLSPFPVFCNTDRANAPADWVNAVQSFEMSRGIPSTV